MVHPFFENFDSKMVVVLSRLWLPLFSEVSGIVQSIAFGVTISPCAARTCAACCRSLHQNLVKGSHQIPSPNSQFQCWEGYFLINTEMCGERPRGGRESVIPHLRNQALGRASWYWCVWDFSVAGLGSCLWLPSSSQNALPPAATESSKGRPPRIEISTQIWTKSSQCSETLPRRKCSSHSTHHPDNRNANPWLVQCVLDATSHTMLQTRSLTRCHWRFRYFVPV